MWTAVCLCWLLDQLERFRLIVHHNYRTTDILIISTTIILASFNYACSSGFRRLMRFIANIRFYQAMQWILYIQQSQTDVFFSPVVTRGFSVDSYQLLVNQTQLRTGCHDHSSTSILQTVYLHASDGCVSSQFRDKCNAFILEKVVHWLNI